MPRLHLSKFRLSSLFLVTAIIALVCTLLFRDNPTQHIAHGTFNVSGQGELAVYEYFDQPVVGFEALPGNWTVSGHWLTYGSNRWLCYDLFVVHDCCRPKDIEWDRNGTYCSVSGSMTSVTDSSFVRENSAFPIEVPWRDQPLTENDPFLGEYDEFWDLKYSLVITQFGVLIQAGNGDDGAFEYFLGRNLDGKVCAVRCVLEDDKEFWINRYYSQPWSKRLCDRLGWDGG
jgi:hypothetical protein